MVMTAPEASELVVNYLRLAYKIANRWTVGTPHLREEFESEAVMELWRCATAFDPERGVKFATAFHRSCRFALIKVLEREFAKSPASFAAQFVPTDKHPLDPVELAADPRPTPEEAAETADDVAALPRLLATIPEDRRSVVVRHIVDGVTLPMLAAERGVTRSAVQQIIGRELARLRYLSTGEEPNQGKL